MPHRFDDPAEVMHVLCDPRRSAEEEVARVIRTHPPGRPALAVAWPAADGDLGEE